MSAPGLGSPLATIANFDKMTAGASGVLYVSATATDWWPTSQLLQRDAEGRWTQLAARGEGLGQVLEVTGMSVDSAGALYLAESGFGRPRVQKRDSDGTWTLVSEALKGPGFFGQAYHLAVDSRGNLYVVDRRQGRVQKRDSEGRWTVVVEVPDQVIQLDNPSFPVGIDATRPAPLWLPVFCLFGLPSSVGVDRQDNLYVAEQLYHRVRQALHRRWRQPPTPGQGRGWKMGSCWPPPSPTKVRRVSQSTASALCISAMRTEWFPGRRSPRRRPRRAHRRNRCRVQGRRDVLGHH